MQALMHQKKYEVAHCLKNNQKSLIFTSPIFYLQFFILLRNDVRTLHY